MTIDNNIRIFSFFLERVSLIWDLKGKNLKLC